MRTTVRIKDDLLQRAKKRATEDGRTLDIVDRRRLGARPDQVKDGPAKAGRFAGIPASGGVLPGVDLNRSGDIEEVMRTP